MSCSSKLPAAQQRRALYKGTQKCCAARLHRYQAEGPAHLKTGLLLTMLGPYSKYSSRVCTMSLNPATAPAIVSERQAGPDRMARTCQHCCQHLLHKIHLHPYKAFNGSCSGQQAAFQNKCHDLNPGRPPKPLPYPGSFPAHCRQTRPHSAAWGGSSH